MFNCSLCPHQCHAPRTEQHGDGRCRMPASPKLARAALHFGEEPCISGTNGSGTVFFSGCALSCVFCQNYEISHKDHGNIVSAERLAEIFRELTAQGAHNINLVNPTHFSHVIREALLMYKPPVPVVYNSSGYERVQTLKSLCGLIDIYLPDFKYADNALAAEFSGIADYREYALAAIDEMLSQTGHLQTENGIAVRGTMIRHLVLPGHTKNSIAVLEDIQKHFGTDTVISLMFQYTPVRSLEQKELNRTLTMRECRKVFDSLCESGFENGYVQDLESACSEFIPSFDLTGI